MAQIFRPVADTWLRVFVVVVLLVVGGLLTAAFGYIRSDYATGANWTVEQPVPFSHQHHVAGLGLDCRYCHSTVEVSSEAGYPPTETCMTCHSQVWTNAPMLAPVRESFARGVPLHWHRVAVVPDYVYFRHDMHIQAGVGCSTCHGRIDKMPLAARVKTFEMHWCLECHRNPGPYLRDRADITKMDWAPDKDPKVAEARMTERKIDPTHLQDCTTCHR